MPADYYPLMVPGLLRRDPLSLPAARRAELSRFGAASRTQPELSGMVQRIFDRVMPRPGREEGEGRSLEEVLFELGFDRVQHEQIRADLRAGRIGLAQNRLPARTVIRDVEPGDVAALGELPEREALRERGLELLREGAAAVVTLAAGAGSRWTEGAGVVKALNPFCKLAGKHRTFLEIHLAKSRRVGRATTQGGLPPRKVEDGAALQHVVTTSFLTDEPIREFLAANDNYGYGGPQEAVGAQDPQRGPRGRRSGDDPSSPTSYLLPPTSSLGPLVLSPGRSVGLRLVPMARDLRFAWEELPQQLLDEQAQKVRDSLHGALIGWAEHLGEGSDYTDNLPLQCLHPVGHWYEVPNMLRNGVLARLLAERPALRVLLVHNIDTVGADVDPALLAWHVESGAAMTVEVIRRHVEDRGGGLARADGRLRLIEGLAMPRERDEFALTYYNTGTMWLDVDRVLAVFGLTRGELGDEEKVAAAVRAVAARMPTYVTLKDVKKRWGQGQEDILPVAQFEKLWGDMTALPELACRYVEVPRRRGQQLKEVAQLDGWLRDGSSDYVASLCAF
jgi:hypothetical protein